MTHTHICYSYWADSSPPSFGGFWVHDTEVCRLAARLEGRTLYRHTNGDNWHAVCQVCGKPFVELEAAHNAENVPSPAEELGAEFAVAAREKSA